MRRVDPDKSYDDELNCWVTMRNGVFQIGLTDWAQGYCGKISSVIYEVSIGDTIQKRECSVLYRI